jgi:hypothetical protein
MNRCVDLRTHLVAATFTEVDFHLTVLSHQHSSTAVEGLKRRLVVLHRSAARDGRLLPEKRNPRPFPRAVHGGGSGQL